MAKQMNAKAVKHVAIALLLTAAVFGGAMWVWWKMNEWGFRRALPSTATDISEWYWSDDMIGDYIYMLKAKVTEAEFQEYARSMGLTPHSESREYSDDKLWLGWDSEWGEAKWWDPSPSLDATLVHQSNDTWTYAKYENGWLYLKSVSH